MNSDQPKKPGSRYKQPQPKPAATKAPQANAAFPVAKKTPKKKRITAVGVLTTLIVIVAIVIVAALFETNRANQAAKQYTANLAAKVSTMAQAANDKNADELNRAAETNVQLQNVVGGKFLSADYKNAANLTTDYSQLVSEMQSYANTLISYNDFSSKYRDFISKFVDEVNGLNKQFASVAENAAALNTAATNADNYANEISQVSVSGTLADQQKQLVDELHTVANSAREAATALENGAQSVYNGARTKITDTAKQITDADNAIAEYFTALSTQREKINNDITAFQNKINGK